MNRPGFEEGFLKGKGGVKLFFRRREVASPKASLAIVHGLAEHSGRYGSFFDYFTKAGCSVYAFDLRGHGHSEGLRAYAETIDDFLEDLHLFLKMVSQRSRKKLFLVGHSFGGQLALNYVAKHSGLRNGRPTGIVLSSPNVRLALQVPAAKVTAGKMLSKILPRLTLANEIPFDFISHDRELVLATKKDPLVQRKITARLGDLILKNQESLFSLAPKINLPSLFLQAGDDKICSAEGAKEFFKEISVEDKSFKLYEGFYHEVFNEVQKRKVFHDLEQWIEKHL
ncbi:MAG: lysophospholipase [Deltaproteobacteria bacterium]|nr:lysophospholipase [Deltaproteobacteria bacterium]